MSNRAAGTDPYLGVGVTQAEELPRAGRAAAPDDAFTIGQGTDEERVPVAELIAALRGDGVSVMSAFPAMPLRRPPQAMLVRRDAQDAVVVRVAAGPLNAQATDGPSPLGERLSEAAAAAFGPGVQVNLPADVLDAIAQVPTGTPGVSPYMEASQSGEARIGVQWTGPGVMAYLDVERAGTAGLTLVTPGQAPTRHRVEFGNGAMSIDDQPIALSPEVSAALSSALASLGEQSANTPSLQDDVRLLAAGAIPG